MPYQPSKCPKVVWLNLESSWYDQVLQEERLGRLEHCGKDFVHVIEGVRNDGANSLLFLKTTPSCQKDHRNSVRDHDIWRFLRLEFLR